MTATLYTFGYLSTSATQTLRELIAVKTPVVDIRFAPVSKREQWTKEQLEKQPGILYYWLQELGNEHYKAALTGDYQEPSIKLHDTVNGLIELACILDEYGRAALLCACTSKKTCHRILVANLAHERLGVQVIHL